MEVICFSKTPIMTPCPKENNFFCLLQSRSNWKQSPDSSVPKLQIHLAILVNTPNLPPASRSRLKYLLIAFHSMNQKQPEPSPSPGPRLSLGSMDLRSCCLSQLHLIFQPNHLEQSENNTDRSSFIVFLN